MAMNGLEDFNNNWDKFLIYQMFANLAMVAIIALLIISNK